MKTQGKAIERWVRFVEVFEKEIPHVASWWGSETDFSEIRVKARADGTCLAVAKGYGSSGGPVVCFAVGYDVASCFLALDATINAGAWKVDKPWDGSKK